MRFAVNQKPLKNRNYAQNKFHNNNEFSIFLYRDNIVIIVLYYQRERKVIFL
jgi:hypothetical protein